jgi:hypothetical protein
VFQEGQQHSPSFCTRTSDSADTSVHLNRSYTHSPRSGSEFTESFIVVEAMGEDVSPSKKQPYKIYENLDDHIYMHNLNASGDSSGVGNGVYESFCVNDSEDEIESKMHDPTTNDAVDQNVAAFRLPSTLARQ